MHRRLSQALNGLICVHKPQERPLKRICRVLAKTLAEEASQAVGPIQRPLIKLPYVESHESGALLVVGENEIEDYRYAPLISGAAFRPEDIRIEPLQDMETTSTGVCVLGVNDGCDELPKLMANSWLSEYRLEGLLGFERVDNRLDTKVNIRAPFDHVNKFMMSKFLARLESEYRKLAFHTANVDLQSEEAFEMARKGLPRTQLPGQTIIYKLELRHFNPPFFTLNVQCTGETDKFMRLFVHEIGLSLGTTASCVRMQRISQGPFTSDHVLIEREFNLQNILRNMSLCRRVLDATKLDPNVVEEQEKDLEKEAETQRREIVDALFLNQSMKRDEEYDSLQPNWPRNYESN